MNLLGYTNGETVVASMGHYDCRTHGALMADGGQPFTAQYAGYSRSSGGKLIWFKVPQSYSELYNDYATNRGDRKYGVWKLSDVKVLNKKQIAAFHADKENEFINNAIWGTYGASGKEKFKYVNLIDCETDHLEKILLMPRLSETISGIIKAILQNRASSIKENAQS